MKIIQYHDHNDNVIKSNELNKFSLSYPDHTPKDKNGNGTGGFLLIPFSY